MAARTFSQFLERLDGPGEAGNERLGEPHFRVSAGVGHTVLALSPQKEATPPRRFRNYEETMEEAQIKPQLTLADLSLRIAEAASAAELRRLRREFARSYHPDHCKADSGCASATGTASANRLIDDAIALLKKRSGANPK